MNDIWSYAIILLLAQGVFVLSLLCFLPKRRQKPENRYLFAVILVFIWFLLEFYSIRNRILIPVNSFYGTRYGSWMVLGPLTYFFFCSATSKKWRFGIKHLIHFLPFLFFVFIIPSISSSSLSHRQIHYGMLAVFDFRPKTVTPFEYVYSTIFYLQFLHLTGYLIQNQIMLGKYVKNLRTEFASLNGTRWLFIFNGLLLLILILASVYLYLLFASDVYSRDLDYIYVLPLGFFIYAIGYKISGVDWLHPEQTAPSYKHSTLKEEDKLEIEKQLGKLMLTEKPYLNNELRLNQLAEQLSISTHHLSQFLNEHHQTSFFDFINKHRVQEAKRLIVDKPNFTLLQIGYEAGFNNKTSFVNAFKRFEGQTPSSYRKTILQD
ncbi:helix-turn-helix domain-containing protein [Flagellimonas sp.]|uniref:AraC family transcriptional regulator n=1 Tax=Flagellimonas sp. TaxID=2058762 RepID=UPI003F4A00FA